MATAYTSRVSAKARRAALLLTLLTTGCASLPIAAPGVVPRLAVLTPFDGVPVRSRDALPGDPGTEDLDAARDLGLVRLRADLVDELRGAGLTIVETDLPTRTGERPAASELAKLGREAGCDAVVFTQLLAYGDIRRSWLWVLAAQGLVAGIGHGVAVAAATGDKGLGWWAGGAEFALETVTWVGGAVLGSRGIDPVLVRVRLVRSSDGAVLRTWTLEGTRPVRRWFRRKGEPPRDERLRAVADHIFAKLAHKMSKRLDSGDQ